MLRLYVDRLWIMCGGKWLVSTVGYSTSLWVCENSRPIHLLFTNIIHLCVQFVYNFTSVIDPLYTYSTRLTIPTNFLHKFNINNKTLVDKLRT